MKTIDVFPLVQVDAEALRQVVQYVFDKEIDNFMAAGKPDDHIVAVLPKLCEPLYELIVKPPRTIHELCEREAARLNRLAAQKQEQANAARQIGG